MSRSVRRPRSRTVMAVAAVSAMALSGCAAPVSTRPAPRATDPVCDRLMDAIPDQVSGQDRRETTARGTAAWGDEVTLWCGEEPPGPTTTECFTVAAPDGPAVDWLAEEDGSVWTFTTYGRQPAVRVEVRSTGGHASAPLVDLAAAVASLPADRQCY